LAPLANDIALYPGHEYLENNLRFALSCEPNNKHVQDLLAKKIWQEHPHFVSTFGLEKQISPFFRLNNQEIIAGLQQKGLISDTPTPEAIFTALRGLRDKW